MTVLLIIIASQVKLEGVFLSVIFFFLPKSFFYRLKLFSISIIPFTIWIGLILVLKIPSDSHIIFPGLALFFERIYEIILGFGKELINIHNWYFFWPIIFLTIFTKQKISESLKRIFLPSYGIIVFLFVLIYLFASNETYTYVTSSFDRVLLQHSAIVFLFFFEKTHKLVNSYINKLTKGLHFI